ncbi:hypothetical protein PIB30_063768 [Stylosanthes scabra]|uniref:Uncharacterized protein n=1 Tax=Stylosanthes scabra TaxID=79078 RepID=A0ABU6VL36_9FABA|nr:hypothetical protein [Stylosanthes scabra]
MSAGVKAKRSARKIPVAYRDFFRKAKLLLLQVLATSQSPCRVSKVLASVSYFITKNFVYITPERSPSLKPKSSKVFLNIMLEFPTRILRTRPDPSFAEITLRGSLPIRTSRSPVDFLSISDCLFNNILKIESGSEKDVFLEDLWIDLHDGGCQWSIVFEFLLQWLWLALELGVSLVVPRVMWFRINLGSRMGMGVLGICYHPTDFFMIDEFLGNNLYLLS